VPAFFDTNKERKMSDSPKPSSSMKRFLSRSEVLTLGGMVIVIFSLFLTWQEISLKEVTPLASMATYLSSSSVTRSGFSLPVRFPLIIFAVLAGCTLLFISTPKNRVALFVFEVICGLGCLLISLRYIAPLPGVVLGVVGSALLLFAASDRFTENNTGTEIKT